MFDHFAANLAFWGALAWCLEWPWLAAGLPLLAALAYASVRHGLDTGREAFLVYGIVYAAPGLCAVVVPRLHGMTLSFGFVLIVVCAAAATLWHLRRRLREPAHDYRWRPSPDEERWLAVESASSALPSRAPSSQSVPAAGAAPARSPASRCSCWGSWRPRCSSGSSAFSDETTLLIAGLVAALAAEWLIVTRRLYASGIEEGLCVAGSLLIGAWITTVIPPRSGFAGGTVATLVLIAAVGAAGLRLLNPLVTTCAVIAFVYWVGSTAAARALDQAIGGADDGLCRLFGRDACARAGRARVPPALA